MLGLLAGSSVCGNDLPLTQPQISIIRAQRVQECSTAPPSPSLFIPPPLSLLPHLRLTPLPSLLLALNPSLALLLFFSTFYLWTSHILCSVSALTSLSCADHQASALPANTKLTSGSVSYFLQGHALSHVMSVYLFAHRFGDGGGGVGLSRQCVCFLQTRADAQGNVYNVTINSCRKNRTISTKASEAINICGYFPFSQWNKSVTDLKRSLSRRVLMTTLSR